jgi:hypothetical protein
VCSETWKRLISRALDTPERISLITTIFSDHNQVNTVKFLSGDNVRTFIDMVHEVSSRKISRPKDELIGFDSDLHILTIRCWIALHHRSARLVWTIYTIFVITKPCFPDHWKFHSAMTQRSIRCVLVYLQTCGRVNFKAERSRPRS